MINLTNKININMKKIFLLAFLFVGTISNAQDDMLCMGRHWTEDEANLVMKDFASQWDDLESWEARATTIRNGIISGMLLTDCSGISP